MANLADIIEQFILGKMSREDDSIIMFRRNEVADEIDCAPSQVSYVLNTRFTVERGYIVESRRGSGGYVRIARVPLRNLVYEDAANQIAEATTLEEMEYITGHLAEYGLMTKREAVLLTNFYRLVFPIVKPNERVVILKSLLLSLAYL